MERWPSQTATSAALLKESEHPHYAVWLFEADGMEVLCKTYLRRPALSSSLLVFEFGACVQKQHKGTDMLYVLLMHVSRCLYVPSVTVIKCKEQQRSHRLYRKDGHSHHNIIGFSLLSFQALAADWIFQGRCGTRHTFIVFRTVYCLSFNSFRTYLNI